MRIGLNVDESSLIKQIYKLFIKLITLINSKLAINYNSIHPVNH